MHNTLKINSHCCHKNRSQEQFPQLNYLYLYLHNQLLVSLVIQLDALFCNKTVGHGFSDLIISPSNFCYHHLVSHSSSSSSSFSGTCEFASSVLSSSIVHLKVCPYSTVIHVHPKLSVQSKRGQVIREANWWNLSSPDYYDILSLHHWTWPE